MAISGAAETLGPKPYGDKADLAELSGIAQVLPDLRSGKPVILVDDSDRENEGDLIIPTAAVSAEILAFMMNHCRGLICVSLAQEVAQRLSLPLQTLSNNSSFQTAFAVSIDHRDVLGRGVTAEGRYRTMRELLNAQSVASDFVSPGAVFPLIAHPSGVIGRRGQTEGSLDLARIAGFIPSGVICEILNHDGTMARGVKLQEFASKHGFKIISVAELVRYRVENEVLVRQVAESELCTQYGPCRTLVFNDDVDGKEHLALIFGDIDKSGAKSAPLVRLHSECLTGDVFGSRRCDCSEQLDSALRVIASEGRGVILYLRQEGRGIGLGNKVRAYELQDFGHDTVEANERLGFAADERNFHVAAKILQAIGIKFVRLITNNPLKLETLEQMGIEVVERVPVIVPATEYSAPYLRTKREKMGHLL